MKKLIRLTEGDLHIFVKESVDKILKEVISLDEKTKAMQEEITKKASEILDEIPNDVDYTKELLDEFDKCVNGDTDSFSYLTDEDVTPQTSGTKTVWPLLEVNSYYFSPLQVAIATDIV